MRRARLWGGRESNRGLACGERGVGGGRRPGRNHLGCGGLKEKSVTRRLGEPRNMGRERPSLEPRALEKRSAEGATLLVARTWHTETSTPVRECPHGLPPCEFFPSVEPREVAREKGACGARRGLPRTVGRVHVQLVGLSRGRVSGSPWRRRGSPSNGDWSEQAP